MTIAVRTDEHVVAVDGRNIRYLEDGRGVPAIMLHGSSLGSSADVFRRNVHALGQAGVRAIAVDFPGFGKSDPTDDFGAAFKKNFVLRFMDALKLERAALIAHSSAGGPAVSVALEHPERISYLIILGTGSLLPPLETTETKVGGREEAAQARLEDRMVGREPSLDDTRALLAANLFHHELITDEELALRHQNSIGRCFAEFVRRHEADKAKPAKSGNAGAPLWQRLVDLKMPLLLIYGRNDRAHAEQRALALKERFPQLDLHLADGCKHLVPWDAADLFHRLAVPFLTT
jgi:2-hydroxy-6-oxonona-2,4-dienedioate hydrolase